MLAFWKKPVASDPSSSYDTACCTHDAWAGKPCTCTYLSAQPSYMQNQMQTGISCATEISPKGYGCLPYTGFCTQPIITTSFAWYRIILYLASCIPYHVEYLGCLLMYPVFFLEAKVLLIFVSITHGLKHKIHVKKTDILRCVFLPYPSAIMRPLQNHFSFEPTSFLTHLWASSLNPEKTVRSFLLNDIQI